MNGYAGSSSPAVKRLAAELREMHRKPSLNYTAEPLEVRALSSGAVCTRSDRTWVLPQDELFEWHFTIAGPPDTAFEGGRFHGRIVMPPDYPMKPPDVYLSTPNGAQPHARPRSRAVSQRPCAPQAGLKPTRRSA